jgi:hypothetical protein
MGALDDLTRLTETAGDTPPYDGRQLFRSRRRRRTRRRVTSGTVATLAVVLVAVVAWPGGDVANRVIVDEFVGPATTPAPVPDGWRRVEVADASVGVPDALEVVELTRTDSEPCHNSGPRVYLAEHGLGPARGCRAFGNPAPVVLVARLSTLSEDRVKGLHGPDDRLDPDKPTNRHVLAEYDLFLEVTTTEDDAGLADDILATVSGRPGLEVPGPSVDEFDRDPISLEDSTVFVQHSKRLTIEVPSCNGRPVVDEVRETATEVRIRVLTNTDSSDECLDGVSVPLEQSLGDRAVIDDVSNSELRLTGR